MAWRKAEALMNARNQMDPDYHGFRWPEWMGLYPLGRGWWDIGKKARWGDWYSPSEFIEQFEDEVTGTPRLNSLRSSEMKKYDKLMSELSSARTGLIAVISVMTGGEYNEEEYRRILKILNHVNAAILEVNKFGR